MIDMQILGPILAGSFAFVVGLWILNEDKKFADSLEEKNQTKDY